MNRFDYIRPASLDEAIAAGAAPGAEYLAGGTALLDLMKTGVAHPGKIVDITRLPGLDRIETLDDGSIRIGALVRNADLARDPGLVAACPVVAEAMLSGASPQIRNAATVAGNLMQHTRCAYFYDPHSACNRREEGAGCDARGGETRGHAILGWSDACIATHPSDFCVPLVALDAVVEIVGPDGRRDVPLADFHPLPGDTTAGAPPLGPGDLITSLRLPADARRFATNARYLKIRDRTSFAFALVSVAALLRLDGDSILDARIALGGVAARPWRSAGAEQALIGATPGAKGFRNAADLALNGASPSGENGFKIDLAKRAIVRALTLATVGTPARIPALPASVFASGNGAASHA